MRSMLACVLIAFVSSVPSPAQTRRAGTPYITYDEAAPIVAALADVLPAGLKELSPEARKAAWPGWVARRDAEIRARLAQGDEDTVLNFLLFGTAFTRQPRATLEGVGRGAAGIKAAVLDATSTDPTATLLRARLADFTGALAAPGQNERLLFARDVLARKGLAWKTAVDRRRVTEYLLDSLVRVLGEQESYYKIIETAKVMGDPSAEFVERSSLFRDRGLSSDTSLLPNRAIEESLAALAKSGVLAPGSVRRVAVIGPGLDFTDKLEGFDFYPQQTIQPFALVDSLSRLGLAAPGPVRVTTFDISPRILGHVARAQARAAAGVPYVIQLPRDTAAGWTPESVAYWTHFGDRVGTAVKPAAVPSGLGKVDVRAVSVRPAVVAAVAPQDLNVVLQRPAQLARGEEYDVIVATNILVYYDIFEQSLALANIGRLLRPGGLLLSNNALLELPSSTMHSIGYQTTVYSSRDGDGDHIVWYQRAAAPAAPGF